MIVLVCGGRDYRDHEKVFEVLDYIRANKGLDLLIHGDAWGADYLAAMWATRREVNALSVPAKWITHGKKAGPIRNKEMLNLKYHPDLVVAFPGGSGTANMVALARSAAITVKEIK